jgi:hypothetical protein
MSLVLPKADGRELRGTRRAISFPDTGRFASLSRF